MTTKLESPAGRATGRGLMHLECLADNPNYSTAHREIQDYIRASFLWRRYGISGAQAKLIAALHFDGGR